jgi:hypothetical protein
MKVGFIVNSQPAIELIEVGPILTSPEAYDKAHESGIHSQSSACNRSYRTHRSGIHLGPYSTLSGAKTKATHLRSFTLWKKCLHCKEAEAAETDCSIKKSTSHS